MCSMKCKGSDSGAFTGESALRNVHCAECSVLPAKDEYLAVETGCLKKIILRNNFLKTNSSRYIYMYFQ